MNEKISIRDIQVSSQREQLDSHLNKQVNPSNENIPPQSTSSYKKKNKKRWPQIVLILVVIGLIFAVISIFFHTATIEVFPKVESVVFNGQNVYEAPYEINDFSFSVEKELESIGVEKQNVKAIGKIKIINNSNSVQKLRKETRFRNGKKIFMTYKSVTVPANSFIIAKAFAVEPGKDGNVSVGTKFDIPGFEEVKSPLFKKMSGEVVEEFTGGFVGQNNIPNKKELEKTRTVSQQELKLLVHDKVIRNLKPNYFLMDDKFNTDFSEKITSRGDKVILKITMDAQAVVMAEADLLKVILNSQEIDSDLKIKNHKDLKLESLSNNIFSDRPAKIKFNLQGKVELYSKFNQDNFLTLIAGKDIEQANKDIKENFKNFKVDIDYFPFWRSSIPQNREDINLKINTID